MRPAASLDVFPVMYALDAFLAKSPAPQMKYANRAVAERSVRRAIKQGRAFISNGFFLMVDVGSDWYSDQRYLIEQIILRVYDTPHKVASVIPDLDKLAEQFDCVLTVVGDTQIGYMTPHYTRAGYSTLGTQLVKERTNGIHSQGNRGRCAD